MNVIKLIGWLHIAAAVMIQIVVRFAHPDFSETRLFIEFWLIWLGSAVILIIGIFLAFRWP